MPNNPNHPIHPNCNFHGLLLLKFALSNTSLCRSVTSGKRRSSCSSRGRKTPFYWTGRCLHYIFFWRHCFRLLISLKSRFLWRILTFTLKSLFRSRPLLLSLVSPSESGLLSLLSILLSLLSISLSLLLFIFLNVFRCVLNNINLLVL